MRFSRRRIILDRSLQFRMVGASLGYVAFYVVAVSAAIFVPLSYTLNRIDPGSHAAYLAANSLIYLHWHVWPVALGVLLVVSLHSLWLSHKVAGPLYRFRHILGDLIQGTLPGRQALRKNDFLQAEMKLINEMLDSLRAESEEIRKEHKVIAQSAAAIAERSRNLEDNRLLELARDLERQGRGLAEREWIFSRESGIHSTQEQVSRTDAEAL